MVKKKVISNKISPLDIAKKAILKKYGDVVKPMSDKPLVIDTVSTRSLGLDAALGRGGLALGRIYEIYGENSSGKCLTSDTYLSSEYGLLTVNELFELHGTPTYISNKNIETSCVLRNEFGDKESTSHFVWSNKHPVNHIKTRSGLSVKCTDNHKLRVIDNNTGFIVWKKSKYITIEDHLLIPTKPSDIQYDDLVSANEATFLGMLIAEGSLSMSNKFSFTNEDSEMLSLFESLVKDIFDFSNMKKYSKDGNTFSYVVHSKEIKSILLKRYSLDEVTAKGKKVPIKIRCGSTENVAKFLSAYFSLDGCYEHKNSVTASSASKELLKQIQLLLLDRFGIRSRTYKKFNKLYDKYYYHIDISSNDVYVFMEKIGFILANKKAKVKSLGLDSDSIPLRWSFPNQKNLIRALFEDSFTTRKEYAIMGPNILKDIGLTDKKLVKIIELFNVVDHGHTADLILDHFKNLSNYTCTKVVSNTKLNNTPVFDVVMPKTHSFISNGLISHNTTLAMSIIAEAQSRGMNCAFIDAEHSADSTLFESMGVDLKALEVIDLYTGEDNLAVAEILMKSGGLDVLVVDSVTSLIPKVQAEKEIGDVNIALLARLMSTTLLRFVPISAETNTLVIFINQVRHKVGGYGNPETTSGGLALGFYSTGRIRVSGVGAKANRITKEDGTVIGHKTTFEMVKNKLATPFTKSTVDLIYGKGYDIMSEIVTIATDLGIINKAGSWYSYGGDNIGQGEKGVRSFFEENHDVFLIIKREITDTLGLTVYYEEQENYDN